MDNLMLLQRQFLKPVKIMLVIVEFMWAVLLAFVWAAGELEEVLYPLGLPLIGLLLINLSVLEARKPSASLKALTPDVLESINGQCLTGLRLGNGILCDNDCLVFVGMTVTAVRLQDVGRLALTTTARGRIDVYGVVGAGNAHRMINGASRRVMGVGTFREADRDTFWKALCDAWKKYSDEEPMLF